MNSMRYEKEHLLDLLVDGELSEADRRELLLWCERDPEGWRRCALAFLEAQSWSGELAESGPDAASAIDRRALAVRTNQQKNLSLVQAEPKLKPAPGTSSDRERLGGGAPRWRVVGWSLAMAASFLISFALGLWARGGWPHATSGETVPAPANMVANQELLGPQGLDGLHRGAAPVQIRPARPQAAMGQVRLVVDGPNGSSDEIELPVVEGNEFDADFLRGRPAAIPLEVERALERMGYRVEQRRELAPLRMQDGRRLIVPVDQVEVHPAGNRAYQ